jgi:hypothetical protein
MVQQRYEFRGEVKDGVDAGLMGAKFRLDVVNDVFYATTDKQGYFVFTLSKPSEGSEQVILRGYSQLKKASALR